MFKIETERLIVRDMKVEDEVPFIAISQDAKYQRFYDEQDCEPSKYKQLTHLFIEQAQENPRKNFQLAIELKATNEFIGTICLRVEPDFQASMGGGLSRSHQGHHFIQEAGISLIDFAFQELNIHRIYAETISENKAAIKLCEQLGMRREALFKDHRYFKSRWWDTVVLAMLESDFRHVK